jgi:hypothetical protein
VIKRGHKKGGLAIAFFAFVFELLLLAEMATAVFALEPGAGLADEAVSTSAATSPVRGHAFPDHALD